MKCPVCNNELHEYSAGTFNVDICRDGCSGIWFDKEELAKCDEHSEPFPPELFRVRKVPSAVIDRSKKRNCPKCKSQTLERVVLDPEIRFEIDRCPKCEGHWLDIGEIEHIRKEARERSEIYARIESYEKKVSEQVKSADARFGVSKLLKAVLR